MSENTQEKKSIKLESLLAGYFLNFNKLDNVDFSLIVDDFKSKTGMEISDIWGYKFNIINKYARLLKTGTIELKPDVSLDELGDGFLSLRDKLTYVAGDIVCDYFKNMTVDKYNKMREETLENGKKDVLNNAHVLLISNIEDDYNEMVKYGFKNIDYFRSFVRADKYFKEHPEELEKYNIILKGGGRDIEMNLYLDNYIFRNSYKKSFIETPFSRYDYYMDGHMEFIAYLQDVINYRNWQTTEYSYEGIFDRIVENLIINHTLSYVENKDKKYEPIVDFINKNRIELPKDIKDLKILYLDAVHVSEFAEGIAKELGLNIVFQEDNNFSISRNVINHMGEYDIIIASETYSRDLTGLNGESTEQCKDTGRELTLLVVQDIASNDIGDRIDLDYSFGGNYAPDNETHHEKYWVIRENIKVDAPTEYSLQCKQSDYSTMKAIIESAVNIYNDALKKKNNTSLKNNKFRTIEEINKEYDDFYKKIEEEEAKENAPITEFYTIATYVIRYLDWKKKGYIINEPVGLNIEETDKGIKVENIYQGKVYCSIIFPKELKEDLYIFYIQTLSKKGVLSEPKTVGIYKNKYENLDGIPDRPDEKQQDAIRSISKKIRVVLRPLTEEGLRRKEKIESERELKLERRRRHNGKR